MRCDDCGIELEEEPYESDIYATPTLPKAAIIRVEQAIHHCPACGQIWEMRMAALGLLRLLFRLRGD